MEQRKIRSLLIDRAEKLLEETGIPLRKNETIFIACGLSALNTKHLEVFVEFLELLLEKEYPVDRLVSNRDYYYRFNAKRFTKKTSF